MHEHETHGDEVEPKYKDADEWKERTGQKEHEKTSEYRRVGEILEHERLSPLSIHFDTSIYQMKPFPTLELDMRVLVAHHEHGCTSRGV